MEPAENQAPLDSETALELREGYLYARLVPGFEITPERMNRLWQSIGEACAKNGVRVEFFASQVEALRWLGVQPTRR
jgi:hypothetical protein